MKNNLILLCFIVATQYGCAMTTTDHSSHSGIGGNSVDEKCSSKCIAKVDAGNDQEKCMTFAQGMASACAQYQGEPQPKGSFSDTP